MIQLNLYDPRQVGKDFIDVTDGTTDVRIAFADTPAGLAPINPTGSVLDR